MSEWIREGTRLPEVLSRVLFLEETVEDARILLVGDPDLAPLLLELGATKVVCALDDQRQLDHYRAAPSSAAVDYRFLRPGVLPGDDGAFDLVIDFNLPQALSRGAMFRLTDINRVLSPDGYALAAVEDRTTGGIRRLFDEVETDVVEGAFPERATYRGFAEAVSEEFELVQVYFQSLLLGFFFGSFDADPGEDGIAPHTGLMGDEAEPASAYLFAFGNAVPEIHDVSLVQLPLEDLLRRRAPRAGGDNARPAPQAVAALEAPAPQPATPSTPPANDDTDVTAVDVDQALVGRIATLEAENQAKEEALEAFSERIPVLKQNVLDLVAEVEAQQADREELALIVDQLRLAVASRDVHLRALQQREPPQKERFAVDDEPTLVSVIEAAPFDAEAVRVAEEYAARARAADEERERLTAALIAAEARLDSLVEEANQAVDDARAQERERNAQSTNALQADIALLREELDVTKRNFAAQQQDLAGVLQECDALREALATATANLDDSAEERHKLAIGVRTLVEERATLLAKLAELEANTSVQAAFAAEKEHFEETIAALRADNARYKGRAAMLEEAVEKISDEAKVEFEKRDLEANRWRQALSDSEASQKAAIEKFRAAQAALSERGRELGAAREQFSEVAGQRDTLQQVLDTRARELEAMRVELAAAHAERDRASAQAEETTKALADAEGKHAALENQVVEERRIRATLERALEDANARAATHEAAFDEVRAATNALEHDVKAAQDAYEDEAAEHEKTRDELGAATILLEEHAAQAEVLRAQWVALNEQHADAIDAIRHQADAINERDVLRLRCGLLEATLSEAQQTLEDERSRGELFGAQLDEAQQTLAAERARGELFSAQLKELQTSMRRERARVEHHAAVLEEAQGELSTERARGELFLAQLIETQMVAASERDRGDLFAAQLDEAQRSLATAHVERNLFGAELDEAQAQLSDGQAVLALQQALLDDARKNFAATLAQAEMFEGQLDEARGRLDEVNARAEMAEAQLGEAQAACAEQSEEARMAVLFLEETQARQKDLSARAELLAAQLDEAQRAAADHADAATLGAALLEEAREAFSAREAALAQELATVQEALEQASKKDHAKIETLVEERQSLEEDLESARRERDALSQTLEHRVAAFEAEREEISKSLDDARQWESRAENESARAEIAEASARELEDSLAHLRAERDALATQAHDTATTNVSLEQANTAFETEIAKRAQEIEAIEASRRSLEETIGGLEESLAAAAAHSREEAARIETLEREHAELRAQLGAVTSEKDEVAQRLETIEESHAASSATGAAALVAATEKTKSLEQALEEAEDALIEIAAERDLLRDAKARSDAEIQERYREHETAIGELRRQLDTSTAALVEAQSAANTVEADAKRAAELDAALDQVREELRAAHSLLDDAKAALEERNQAFASLENARAAIERDSEIATENLTRLQDEVMRAQTRADAAEANAANVSGHVVALEQALAAARESASATEVRASALGERVAKLERDLEDAARAVAIEVEARVRDAQTNPGSAPVDAAAELREELRASIAACEQAEVERDTATQLLEQLQARVDEAEARVDEAEVRADAALRRAANAEAVMGDAQPADVQALTERVAALEGALTAKQAEVEDKIERINRLTERLVRLEGTL